MKPFNNCQISTISGPGVFVVDFKPRKSTAGSSSKSEPLAKLVTKPKNPAKTLKTPAKRHENEKISMWNTVYVYCCFGALFLIGFLKDLIRPQECQEENREVNCKLVQKLILTNIPVSSHL